MENHLQKNNSMAGIARTLGNSMLQKRKFYDALENYNKSLCFAECGSENVALAYGNRSAVYFEMKEYEKCLENIQMARDADYPKEKIGKLNEREAKCEKLMKQPAIVKDDPWDFFKLSYPPNEKLPFIVNCLELYENEKYGRLIVATQDLKTGDIIAIEKTPFKMLNGDASYIRCANCFKSNKMSLIPFEHCAKAMFCSSQCREYGKDKFMCAVDEEISIFPRITLQALEVFGGDLKKLKAFMDDPESSKKTIFDFDMSDPDEPNYMLHQLLAVNSLMRNKLSEKLNSLLDSHPVLLRWKSKEDKRVVKDFMLLVTDLMCNALGFDWWELKKEGGQLYPASMACRKVAVMGNGLFPFSSLFNHSCNFNAERFGVDDAFVIFVRLPIKKGQQIFITYGCNFDGDDRKTRQMKLKILFDFTCTCEACKNDWQRASKLKHIDRSFKHPAEVIKSVEAAKLELTRNCRYIEKNFPRFPNFEVTRLLERNFYLLSAIGKMEPCNL